MEATKSPARARLDIEREIAEVKGVSFHKSKGRYNWAGTEDQYCVSFQATVNGERLALNETWDLDDEPNTGGCSPSEVVDIIEERVKRYWISTSRDKQLATIAKLREHMVEIEDAWARAEIARLQKRIDNLSCYVMDTEEAATND